MHFVDRFIDWSCSLLPDSQEASAYVRGRGVSKEQCARHSLGYVGGIFEVDPTEDPEHSPACGDKEKRGQWCDSCRFSWWSSSWERDEGVEEGPKTRRPGRRIQDSIVFPLTSYSGATVGFQTRSIAEKSYDTFLVKRRPEGFFFGIAPNIHQIWSSREIWLSEGPFDFLLLERLVARNAAALATNAVGPMHLRFLRRFVDKINFCGDLDKAGREGFQSLFQAESSSFLIRDVKYPRLKEKDKDLGDFWKRAGDSAFQKHFEKVIADF
jgi:DNA primase